MNKDDNKKKKGEYQGGKPGSDSFAKNGEKPDVMEWLDKTDPKMGSKPGYFADGRTVVEMNVRNGYRW